MDISWSLHGGVCQIITNILRVGAHGPENLNLSMPSLQLFLHHRSAPQKSTKCSFSFCYLVKAHSNWFLFHLYATFWVWLPTSAANITYLYLHNYGIFHRPFLFLPSFPPIFLLFLSLVSCFFTVYFTVRRSVKHSYSTTRQKLLPVS